MIKYIGLLLILLTSVFTGLTLTSRLDVKIKILGSIKLLLQNFKIEITYNATTVAELFSSYTDEYISQITGKISENLSNGMSLKESTADVFKSSSCVGFLSEEENTFLINIFSSLGINDTESQILLLENAVNRLDFYIESAVENKRKNSKVYLTTSIYAGLALVIILL